MYIRINQLKNLNPELKTMLAIGKAFHVLKILHKYINILLVKFYIYFRRLEVREILNNILIVYLKNKM